VSNKISDDDLINNLISLKYSLGRTPKKEDLSLKNGSKYSINAYKRAFGSLEIALLSSGMKPNQVRNKSKKNIIDDLINVYNKIGKTPSQEEYFTYSNIRYTSLTIKKIFGSWTKLLLEAEIPVINAKNIDKQDIINALKKWYRENNNIRCLEYWSIRKAKENGKFPYSCNTIKKKFDNILWEDIMKKIDKNYKTKDIFYGRHIHKGNDGNKYLSSIEKKTGDILFDLKNKGLIKNYEYEKRVCNNRSWTCDFYTDGIWIEVDGMKNSRKYPYDNNEKIKYYNDNKFNYIIISYRDTNIRDTIIKNLNNFE